MRAPVSRQLFAATALVQTLAAGASAQSPLDAARNLRDDLHNQAASDTEAERVRRDRARARSEAARGQLLSPDRLGPAPGGPCFAIRTVTITGFEPFGEAPEGAKELEGHCATAEDIAAAVNRINAWYQAAGYVTTRAYLPEQDVADGALEIAVVAGRIDGFVYKDGRQSDRRIAGAFPTGRGDLLNLRDVEQGLDNLNAPRSTKAKFRLLPSGAVGGSLVEIDASDGRPLYASLSTANTGFETTGVVQSTATIGLDNMFGVNDQLSLGLSTTPFDARGTRYSDAISLSALVPYGDWSFGVDAGMSRYFFILDGINQSYPVSGRAGHVTVSVEKLLTRDDDDKLFAHGDLKLTRSRSYISDYEIESQRRNLTIATLGLRGERLLEAGRIDWDLGARFGLDAFNSYVLDKSVVDPTFTALYASLALRQSIGDTGLTYQGRASGLWSDDVLPSTEQITIGGWSNVRGFHDDNLYGDTGIWLANTLEWLAYDEGGVSARLQAGLDFGVLKPSLLREWDQNHLVGLSIGADITAGEHVAVSMRLAYALDRPMDFNAPRTIGTLGVNIQF